MNVLKNPYSYEDYSTKNEMQRQSTKYAMIEHKQSNAKTNYTRDCTLRLYTNETWKKQLGYSLSKIRS